MKPQTLEINLFIPVPGEIYKPFYIERVNTEENPYRTISINAVTAGGSTISMDYCDLPCPILFTKINSCDRSDIICVPSEEMDAIVSGIGRLKAHSVFMKILKLFK